MSLGNSEAVRKGNAREAARAPRTPSPAKETAEQRVAETPEARTKPPAKRAPSEYEERAEDLRRAIPGISDQTISELLEPYKLEK
jgi:hypothetical protein